MNEESKETSLKQFESLDNTTDMNLELEIIEAVQHLNSLITLYVLIENPPVQSYYADLCGRLENFARRFESSSRKPFGAEE